MRDVIARALSWVLALLVPRKPGRHSAAFLAAQTPEPEPAPVSPWSRPWRGPSSQEVRAIFRNEHTRELPDLQRERMWAAEFAALGVDYDYPTLPLGSLVKRERVAA
ncbi:MULTISPECIES: hypothetical protein [unclassified Streptomyces]|uniref:hypothetical protein n=1 Tax=unclassified Streptomyces TaxID=2593676 RepID=UPI001F03639D|nr:MULTISPECIES: hypothetical protein [unclassified Streptomyces]MCH0564375.1 hypothetical protein [Streptomyces sp. MUM 2J]MCH0569546.1 hypothetical protein [Streptomyces sp. MUM 136J]